MDVTISLNPIGQGLIAPVAFFVAQGTKGNNVQPILFGIAFMMVVDSLFAAVGTSLGYNTGKSMIFNCVINGLVSPYLLRVLFGIPFRVFVLSLLTLVGFPVTISRKPAFSRLVIVPADVLAVFGFCPDLITFFTLVLISVSSGFVFAKCFDRFNFFAFTTSFLDHLASFKKTKALCLSSCRTPISTVTLQTKGLISYYNRLVRFGKVTSKRLASYNNYTTKGAIL